MENIAYQKYIIIEGQDRCGKDTQIGLIQKHFNNDFFHVFHYSKVPFNTNMEHISVNTRMYKDMFQIMIENLGKERNFIFNRSHLGESVYSKRYRKYDGSYVFDIEKNYTHILEHNLMMIVLVNTPLFLLEREDGLSLSKSVDDIHYERNAFIEAFNKSSIKFKKLIECDSKSIEIINQEIINFIQNSCNII